MPIQVNQDKMRIAWLLAHPAIPLHPTHVAMFHRVDNDTLIVPIVRWWLVQILFLCLDAPLSVQ